MRTIRKRRRLEQKTNYKKRIKTISGGFPRIVLRKSNKYMFAQYVISKEAQDKIVGGVSSKTLIEYGWPEKYKGSLKSLPASYLTGLLIGKKIVNKESSERVIIDLGMMRKVHKSRIYAFMKGIQDSGVPIITSNEEIFPSKDRISGKHIESKKELSEIFNRVKENIVKKHG
jgi:large subunit ribosomal protein L18